MKFCFWICFRLRKKFFWDLVVDFLLSDYCSRLEYWAGNLIFWNDNRDSVGFWIFAPTEQTESCRFSCLSFTKSWVSLRLDYGRVVVALYSVLPVRCEDDIRVLLAYLFYWSSELMMKSYWLIPLAIEGSSASNIKLHLRTSWQMKTDLQKSYSIYLLLDSSILQMRRAMRTAAIATLSGVTPLNWSACSQAS